MYFPMITQARTVSRYVMGPYLAVVLTDCESIGAILYKHAVIVYRIEMEDKDGESPQPVMAVAAEISALAADQDSFFLGVFPGEGHMNLGQSPEWGELGKFTTKALKIVSDHLGVSEQPFLLPDRKNRVN